MTTEEMMQVESKNSPKGATRLPADDMDTKKTKGKVRKMSPTQQTADTEKEKSHPESTKKSTEATKTTKKEK